MVCARPSQKSGVVSGFNPRVLNLKKFWNQAIKKAYILTEPSYGLIGFWSGKKIQCKWQGKNYGAQMENRE